MYTDYDQFSQTRSNCFRTGGAAAERLPGGAEVSAAAGHGAGSAGRIQGVAGAVSGHDGRMERGAAAGCDAEGEVVGDL